MERGQQRFNITCAMCHGATAAGNGIVKQHGLATVVSLQDDRIRKMADGEIFNTVTNGKNTMMAYGPTIMVADRWAIRSEEHTSELQSQFQHVCRLRHEKQNHI